jgi:hypothetical protein
MFILACNFFFTTYTLFCLIANVKLGFYDCTTRRQAPAASKLSTSKVSGTSLNWHGIYIKKICVCFAHSSSWKLVMDRFYLCLFVMFVCYVCLFICLLCLSELAWNISKIYECTLLTCLLGD